MYYVCNTHGLYVPSTYIENDTTPVKVNTYKNEFTTFNVTTCK